MSFLELAIFFSQIRAALGDHSLPTWRTGFLLLQGAAELMVPLDRLVPNFLKREERDYTSWPDASPGLSSKIYLSYSPERSRLRGQDHDRRKKLPY